MPQHEEVQNVPSFGEQSYDMTMRGPEPDLDVESHSYPEQSFNMGVAPEQKVDVVEYDVDPRSKYIDLTPARDQVYQDRTVEIAEWQEDNVQQDIPSFGSQEFDMELKGTEPELDLSAHSYQEQSFDIAEPQEQSVNVDEYNISAKQQQFDMGGDVYLDGGSFDMNSNGVDLWDENGGSRRGKSVGGKSVGGKGVKTGRINVFM